MSFSSFVARVGSNPQFVAFNAHWGVTAFVLLVASHKMSLYLMIWAVLILAAVKEFYFDARYEAGQTFLDNLEDWMGYAVGCGAAILASQ